jgi:hypothetical protein
VEPSAEILHVARAYFFLNDTGFSIHSFAQTN